MNCFDKALCCLLSSILLLASPVHAQNKNRHDTKQVWEPDLGNGRYRNPIIHADYSDPDVIRVGNQYYMIASSFNSAPGLPLLQSSDMIHWNLVGHALQNLIPNETFSTPQHGKGVWAPSLRFHDDKFWIFYPDPDFGIYVMTAKNFAGPWTSPHLLVAGKGLIDPTPLWDDDDKAWLLHAWAKSRAGFNNQLTLRAMTADASKLLDDKGTLVVDGNLLPGYKTLEGPKFYKRKGWYYIFAPAGGVEFGWQSVFRSKNIQGPYENKIVLAQGDSKINGPHQGAWVNAEDGRDWFYHFQDKRAYGRIVHLQPMRWENDWPVMGNMNVKTGIGEPVMEWEKPVILTTAASRNNPATSDDFTSSDLGLQWQWQANWSPSWFSLSARHGYLRLFSLPWSSDKSLAQYPALLMQKLPAETFTVDTSITLNPNVIGLTAGLSLFGMDYAWLGLKNTGQEKQVKQTIIYAECKNSQQSCSEHQIEIADLGSTNASTETELKLYLRLQVKPGAQALWLYSVDGMTYHSVLPDNVTFQAKPGRWVGAKLGLFSLQTIPTSNFSSLNKPANDSKSSHVYADFGPVQFQR
jgi:beta-xylosidase